MSDNFFYSQIEENSKNSKYISLLKHYSQSNMIQMYLIEKPLGENKYSYNYKDAIIILVPKYKIILLNIGNPCDGYEDFCEDFAEDLGHISDKYEYKKVLGRPRKWKDDFIENVDNFDLNDGNIIEFFDNRKLVTKELERNGEFLISLLTGSINDVNRIGGEFPETLLDKVKKNIILFDSDQTKFIYQKVNKKRVVIQGLAGTGKTELLLHKLKELYTNETKSKIVFTCHNKILAQNLKVRIPEFFNFMKVDEQIKWETRLWTIGSWGARANPNSGMYSYICSYYGIDFKPYSWTRTFEEICKEALEHIEKLEKFQPCFDYILIDESQDFNESFFKLCEKVTSKTIYIAGDIFQNVFDNNILSQVTPDFLLNKCYRTAGKTLMLSHAIGMGLCENPKIRWLTDSEWSACGYKIKRIKEKFILKRNILRRFRDLEDFNSVELIPTKDDEFASNVLKIIEKIISENPTVKPEDIGIVFLENSNTNYTLANKLGYEIKDKFKWKTNLGYESKIKESNSLFISNRNNVKGLEFPFVICITTGLLSTTLRQRNSIYMMLTRSFITSYFIVSTKNENFIENYTQCLKIINNKKALILEEPSDKEKKRLRNAIINDVSIKKSQFDLVGEILKELDVAEKYRKKLQDITAAGCEPDSTREELFEFIQHNYKFFKSTGN